MLSSWCIARCPSSQMRIKKAIATSPNQAQCSTVSGGRAGRAKSNGSASRRGSSVSGTPRGRSTVAAILTRGPRRVYRGGVILHSHEVQRSAVLVEHYLPHLLKNAEVPVPVLLPLQPANHDIRYVVLLQQVLYRAVVARGVQRRKVRDALGLLLPHAAPLQLVPRPAEDAGQAGVRPEPPELAVFVAGGLGQHDVRFHLLIEPVDGLEVARRAVL